MKILITSGGTGGHIFPAMALAHELKAKRENLQVIFAGGGLKKNRYFEKEKFPFQDISCGPVSLSKPLTTIKSFGKIFYGIKQSRRLIREFAPDLVIGFGSYYTFPTLVAAKLEKCPIVLHEANRIPGKVNRIMAPYVAMTGISYPDTAMLLKGKTVPANIPLRPELKKNRVGNEEAYRYFNLDSKRLTFLIFGGSQGAHAINRFSVEALQMLPQALKDRLQILHFAGDQLAARQMEAQYDQQGLKATVKDFETRMHMAWQIADIMISRAGAGTLAEQLEFEVPAILVPYPFAADNHQESNADYMVDVIGGAVKMAEKDLSGHTLSQKIQDVMNRRDLMKEAMKTYKQSNVAQEFSTFLLTSFLK